MTDLDPRYVAARQILLDALIALEPHLHAVIVVGAHAVYIRVGDAGRSSTRVATSSLAHCSRCTGCPVTFAIRSKSLSTCSTISPANSAIAAMIKSGTDGARCWP